MLASIENLEIMHMTKQLPTTVMIVTYIVSHLISSGLCAKYLNKLK